MAQLPLSASHTKGKRRQMNKKKDKLATTHSGYPQFESIDIHELENFKKQVIEDMYEPTNTPFEIKAYERIVTEIEEHQLQYVTRHYYLDGKFPDGTKQIVSFSPNEPDQNKADFKIDDWSELEMKIGTYDVTLVKKGTSSTTEYRLKKLGWKNNLKTHLLRTLSKGELSFADFVPMVKSKQSIKNQIYMVNKKLKDLFNMSVNPIEHNNGKWTTLIDIKMLDADEYLLDVNRDLNNRKIFNELTNDIRNKGYDETYNPNAMQDYLRTRHNEDEEY